jgi:hypothetical protein
MSKKSREKWEQRNVSFEAAKLNPPLPGKKWKFWRRPPESTKKDAYPYPDYQPGN